MNDDLFTIAQSPRKKRKPLKYLALEERKQIQHLFDEGISVGDIADKLQRSHRCIRQEIKKNTIGQKYDAQTAHELARVNLSEKQKKASKTRRRVDIDLEKGIIDLYKNGKSYAFIAQHFCKPKTTVRDILKRNGIETNDPVHILKERIDGLEMAIQTLTELLEEIKNDGSNS
jgi:IS30 family transposase